LFVDDDPVLHRNKQTTLHIMRELLQQSLGITMHEHPTIEDIAQLQRQVCELKHFQRLVRELDALREANRVVQVFQINNKILGDPACN
jgi:hypothetical protein